jgi:hypothetical protein
VLHHTSAAMANVLDVWTPSLDANSVPTAHTAVSVKVGTTLMAIQQIQHAPYVEIALQTVKSAATQPSAPTAKEGLISKGAPNAWNAVEPSEGASSVTQLARTAQAVKPDTTLVLAIVYYAKQPSKGVRPVMILRASNVALGIIGTLMTDVICAQGHCLVVFSVPLILLASPVTQAIS